MNKKIDHFDMGHKYMMMAAVDSNKSPNLMVTKSEFLVNLSGVFCHFFIDAKLILHQ